MPITISSAIIVSMNVIFSQGVASQIEVSYIDDHQNPAVNRFVPSPTQQTTIDNFLASIIPQVQTVTGLTMTVSSV